MCSKTSLFSFSLILTAHAVLREEVHCSGAVPPASPGQALLEVDGTGPRKLVPWMLALAAPNAVHGFQGSMNPVHAGGLDQRATHLHMTMPDFDAPGDAEKTLRTGEPQMQIIPPETEIPALDALEKARKLTAWTVEKDFQAAKEFWEADDTQLAKRRLRITIEKLPEKLAKLPESDLAKSAQLAIRRARLQAAKAAEEAESDADTSASVLDLFVQGMEDRKQAEAAPNPTQAVGRSAKEIFVDGIKNLQKPGGWLGWFFGKPSPLYSGADGRKALEALFSKQHAARRARKEATGSEQTDAVKIGRDTLAGSADLFKGLKSAELDALFAAVGVAVVAAAGDLGVAGTVDLGGLELGAVGSDLATLGGQALDAAAVVTIAAVRPDMVRAAGKELRGLARKAVLLTEGTQILDKDETGGYVVKLPDGTTRKVKKEHLGPAPASANEARIVVMDDDGSEFAQTVKVLGTYQGIGEDTKSYVVELPDGTQRMVPVERAMRVAVPDPDALEVPAPEPEEPEESTAADIGRKVEEGTQAMRDAADASTTAAIIRNIEKAHLSNEALEAADVTTAARLNRDSQGGPFVDSVESSATVDAIMRRLDQVTSDEGADASTAAAISRRVDRLTELAAEAQEVSTAAKLAAELEKVDPAQIESEE
jgi:hypothetical protein